MPTELEIERYKLQGSLLDFTQIFYKLRTGRTFKISCPPGRESHHITIIRELVKVINGETKRLIINVAPRYGKTELIINFVAWALAQFPKSNFIYVSYSHSLAKKQTHTIKQIIESPHYRKIMGVELRGDTQAKDNFETTAGGSVYAVGSGGTITGRGAGIQGEREFGGAIVCDDLLKPDEATSDIVREGVNEWYYNTLQSRTNSPHTPIIFIGQRLHEDDICARLIGTGEYKTVILPAIDVAGNALHPEMHDIYTLRKMQHDSPYNFASQYQQDPQPAGGGIFKPEWFKLYDIEPKILATFITVDSAETDKDYNDATVFSFFGIYKIINNDVETGLFGLHWIDCVEIRVEPKDLHPSFLNFYSECMRHKQKPTIVAIEKKSTGVTLLSVLKDFQGLHRIEIERNRTSGSKIERFLASQQYVAQGLVSLPEEGRHTAMCLEHMRKITANNSHRFDDIADTLADGIKLALIDRTIITRQQSTDYSSIAKSMSMSAAKIERLRNKAYRV
jgi:hypothetical protein